MKYLMWLLVSLALAALSVQDAAGARLGSPVLSYPEKEEKTTNGQGATGAVAQAGLTSLAGLQEESAGSGRKEALPSGEDAAAPIKKAQDRKLTDEGYVIHDNSEMQTAVSEWCSDEAAAEAKYGHISTWNTGQVTSMRYLFAPSGYMYGGYCGSGSSNNFNADISAWDVSSVTDMHGMFAGATSFSGDVSEWDVSSVTNMTAMFWGATSFSGDVSEWDVSSVTNMYAMFWRATSFSGDVSKWVVSSVTSMYQMFRGATSFSGDVSEWVVSSVTDMSLMFYEATSFDKDLCWNRDLSGVTTIDMFLDSGGGSLRNDCAQCGGGEFRMDPDTCGTCPADTFAPEPCSGCSGAVSCSPCDSGMTSAPGSIVCAPGLPTPSANQEANQDATPGGGNTGAICFTGDSLLTLKDGSTKKFRDLQVGDMIFSADRDGIISASPVLFLPHPENDITRKFDEVTLANGMVVRMTRNHLIPLCDGSLVTARSLKEDDCLMTMDGMSKVATTKHNVEAGGIYTAVTENEFLVVDGVVASPFALAHGIAHSFFDREDVTEWCKDNSHLMEHTDDEELKDKISRRRLTEGSNGCVELMKTLFENYKDEGVGWGTNGWGYKNFKTT